MARDAIFKVETNAQVVTKKLRGAPARVRTTLNAAFRGEFSDEVTNIFYKAAPYSDRDSTHLRDELDARVAFGGRATITVVSPVRSSEGFPYTQVTRTGRANIETKTKKALSWPEGIRRRVPAWSPGHDWVEEADGEAERYIATESRRLGRVLKSVVL